MVNRIYTPADRRLPTELKRIQASLADVQRPTGTEKTRAVMQIQDLLESLQSEVEFLAGQMTFASGVTGVAREVYVSPAQNGSTTWLAFDPAYDAIATFVAPASGVVSINVSAYCLAAAGAGITSNDSVVTSAMSLVGYEVIDSNGAQVLAPSRPRATSSFAGVASFLASPAAMNNGGTSGIQSELTGLTPGEEYRVRTRMGHEFGCNTSATYTFSWQRATTNNIRLLVTKQR